MKMLMAQKTNTAFDCHSDITNLIRNPMLQPFTIVEISQRWVRCIKRSSFATIRNQTYIASNVREKGWGTFFSTWWFPTTLKIKNNLFDQLKIQNIIRWYLKGHENEFTGHWQNTIGNTVHVQVSSKHIKFRTKQRNKEIEDDWKKETFNLRDGKR